MKPLWLYRPVLNTDDIIRWAGEVRVKKIVPPEQLHATILVVRDAVKWPEDLQTDELVIQGAKMQIFGFTVKALAFQSEEIEQRHSELASIYPHADHAFHLRPHVTLFRGGKMVKEPYQGEIILGPERVEEFSEEKGRNIKHESVAALLGLK